MIPNTVRAGRTTSFNFQLEGEGAASFTVTMRVKQHPDDTAAIIKNVVYDTSEEGYVGTLTGAETLALGVGQWFVHFNAIDDDEDLGEPVKLYISKGWV